MSVDKIRRPFNRNAMKNGFAETLVNKYEIRV